MPSVQDQLEDEKPMATNAITSGGAPAQEPEDEKPSRTPSPDRSAEGPAFFTIYKKGQGKWTRLGTIFAVAGLALLTAYNLYSDYLPRFMQSRDIMLGTSIGFLAVLSLVTFWLSNKPQNVDFLIATDSEMKKVNWTTKGELFGSTRVVILFLAFIAIFLFLVDIVFAEFFHMISVLRSGPFQ